VKTLFGNVSEVVEIIQRTKLGDGRTQTVSKAGNLTVTTTSNKPSTQAIERAGDIMNRIAEKHVDKHGQQVVA